MTESHSTKQTALLYYMFLEEWRMHTEAFGKARFIIFPLIIALFSSIVAVGGQLIVDDVSALIIATHVMILLMGVQSSEVALEAESVLENVVGDITYILFIGNHLPATNSGLFRLFIIKDIVYYCLLFILPVTVGVSSVGVITALPFGIATIPILFFTYILTFSIGVAGTIAAVAGIRRTALYKMASAGCSVVFIGIIIGEYIRPTLHIAPYSVYQTGKGTTLVLSALTTVGMVIAATVIYELPSQESEQETYTSDTMVNWNRTVSSATERGVAVAQTAIGFDIFNSKEEQKTEDATQTRNLINISTINILVTRTLIDIFRSPGGWVKLAFVPGLLAASTVAVDVLFSSVGFSISTPLLAGIIIAISGYISHTWTTEYDSIPEYTIQPLSVDDVIIAKLLTGLVVMIPSVIWYIITILALEQGGALPSAILGGVCLVTGYMFIYANTLYFAGFNAYEFLFDSYLFSLFSTANVLVFTPLVIIALAHTEIPSAIATASLLAIVAGVTAIIIVHTPRRWGELARKGDV